MDRLLEAYNGAVRLMNDCNSDIGRKEVQMMAAKARHKEAQTTVDLLRILLQNRENRIAEEL